MTPNSQPFQSMKRTGIVEDIIENIKQALIAGDLKPGQRLPSEAELVEQLEVGRGTVREAMKMLSAMGVIDIRQGDGTYIVEKPSTKLLNPLVFAILLEQGTNKELFELRPLIEIGYCLLAGENATEDDLVQIEEAAEAWESYVLSPESEIDRLIQLDLNLHYALLEATHNSLVITIGRTVEELFLNSIRKLLSDREVLEWGIEGHRRIIEALHSRDPEAIRQAVIFSLEYWERT